MNNNYTQHMIAARKQDKQKARDSLWNNSDFHRCRIERFLRVDTFDCFKSNRRGLYFDIGQSYWALVYFSNRSSETLVFNYSHERIYYLTTLSLTCATSLAGMMKNNDGLIKYFERCGDKK